MFAKLYLATVCCVAVVELFRPLYGMFFLIILFMTRPGSVFFPEYNDYHLPLVLAGILFLSVIFRGLRVRQKGIVVLECLFLLFAFFSCIFCGHVDEVKWLGVFYPFLKAFVFITILIGFIHERKSAMQVIKICVLGGVLNGFYAICQQVFPSSETLALIGPYGLLRASGFYGDPNDTAALLVAIVPLAYYFFLHGENRLTKRLYVIAICLLVGGIFSTISRGGLVGLCFVGMCIFMKDIKKISTVFVFALVFLGFFYFAKDLYEKRETVRTGPSGQTTIDTSGRLDAYRDALVLWIHNPFLGVGPRRFADARIEIVGGRRRIVAHNTFLQVLAEHGLLGFCCFMGFILIAFKSLARLRRGALFYREAARYVQIGLMGYLFCALFISIQRSFLVWIILMLPIVLENVYASEQAET